MFVGRMASPVGNYVIQCFLRTAMITQIGKNLIQSLICPFCIKHNPCQIINVIIIEYTASYYFKITGVEHCHCIVGRRIESGGSGELFPA